MNQLSPLQQVEATLIQHDLNDLVRLFAHVGVSGLGALAFATLPLCALVVEETNRYVSRASFPVDVAETSLFTEYPHLVTKSRARVKLFDDTEGGERGLIELLGLAHAKSVELFSAPHRGRGILGWIACKLQPDLGVYFVGEHVVATTHTALPVLTTRAELEAAPLVLGRMQERAHDYAVRVGQYIKSVSEQFESFDKGVTLEPAVESPTLSVTHSDFSGKRFYRKVSAALQPREPRFVGALVMALAHVNSAAHLFPQLLPADSNLLFRTQFLTAYHAIRVLERAVPHLLPRTATPEVLNSRVLRNTCAHYGLNGPARAAALAVGQPEAFGAAVSALAGMHRPDLQDILHRRLAEMSERLGARLNKTALAGVGALMGVHT